jgi:hypothetical protein
MFRFSAIAPSYLAFQAHHRTIPQHRSEGMSVEQAAAIRKMTVLRSILLLRIEKAYFCGCSATHPYRVGVFSFPSRHVEPERNRDGELVVGHGVGGRRQH